MPTCSVPSALPQQEADYRHVKECPDCQAKEDAEEEVESCTHITEALVSHHSPCRDTCCHCLLLGRVSFFPDLGFQTLKHLQLRGAEKILWGMVSKLTQGVVWSIRAPSQHHSL